jgi:hypothetical protein
MAWAPVIFEFSRSRGDTSDLMRIEHATNRSGNPPLLQTTESCELHTQEQDQSDNKQLAGVSKYHRDWRYLIAVRLMQSFKTYLFLAQLGFSKITEMRLGNTGLREVLFLNGPQYGSNHPRNRPRLRMISTGGC